MTTALTVKPPVLLTQSLSPQDLKKHRAWIGIRVEASLGHFWKDDPAPAVKAMMLADWMDALANYQPSEIEAAFRDWQREKDYKPKPANIRALIIEARKASQPVTEFRTANQMAFDEAGTKPREKFDSDAILAEIATSKRAK